MLTALLLLVGIATANEPVDDAMNALAEGRDASALQILRRALVDDPDDEIRCLLGRVALGTGRPAEALTTLDAVSPDAPCAQQAAFVQAEALAALDRLDDAAARYEAMGSELLGPARHRATAERLERWADRLLAEPLPQVDRAAELLDRALGLELAPDHRLAIARRLAELGHGGRAIDVLVAAIADASDLAAGDRRLLAPLLAGREGLRLLAPLPDDPATQAARVRAAADLELETRLALAHTLVEQWPDSPEAAAVRLEVGLELASAGWVQEAHEMLGPVTTGESDDAPAATWALARLASRSGAPDAIERLDALLERFPLAEFRGEAESLRAKLRMDAARIQAREAGGAAAFAPLLADQPDDAALALEAAWAATGADRLRRLEEIAARWPWSDQARAAVRARVQEDPEGGWAWLEAQARTHRLAAEVRAALQQPWLALRSPGRQPSRPVVEIGARGVSSVEMRLHRIDVEGYVRAGRGPDDLADLDVGIIAPDRTWTVEIPDPGRGREALVEVPVPVPGPGLYAVTAVGADQEAQTTLLVSDVELVARAVGDQLVAAAFRDGRPVSGARLLAVGARGAAEARADADGLMRLTAPEGALVVLTETPGGPAMLALRRSPLAEDRPERVAVDLDRPAYRPGDTVRFRALATVAGEAVQGRWRVELRGRDVHQILRLQTDRFGAVQGEVVLPLVSSGRTREGALRRTFTLIGLPPGRDVEVELASLVVADDVPAANDLSASLDGVARLVVRDGLDVPLADHPVHYVAEPGEDVVLRTDSAGRVEVPAAPDGLPWRLHATVPLSRLRAGLTAFAEGHTLDLTLDGSRWRPEQEGTVTLEGSAGPLRLRVMQLDAEPDEVAPLAAPARITDLAPVAYEALATGDADDDLARTVHEQLVTLGEEPLVVRLPALPPGHYRIVAARDDGLVAPVRAEVEVRDGLRLVVDGEPRIGGTAPTRVEGGYALVTVEQGRLLEAAVVRPGQLWTPRIDRRWHGLTHLVASTPEGSQVRPLTLDAHLDLALDATIADGRWIVDVTVTDPAGNPADASVLVRAVDTELVAEIGAPRSLSLTPFLLPWLGDATAAVARTLRAAAVASPVAAALLEEARRQEQKERAKQAAEGRLAENAVRGLLAEEVPLAEGLGGLSTSGYGAGGSGVGHHYGGTAGVGGGKAEIMGGEGVALRGEREVGLWRIVRTDGRGRVRIEAPAPTARASWRVEAIALGDGTVGHERVEVTPPERPLLVLDPVAPGWPGDVARPRARVVAPPDGARVTLEIDGEPHPLELGSGEVGTVQLPPTPAGTSRRFVLRAGDEVVEERTWVWPLAAGHGAADGDVHVAVVGRPGGTPLAALALEDDPLAVLEPARAAVAGRAALAALPHLAGEERDLALERVRSTVAAVREAPPTGDARDAAQALLLIAEAAPILDLPRSAVDDAVGLLAPVEPETPRARLELTWAVAVATGDADAATVGRLVRDADLLDDEGRSLLARLLDRLAVRPAPASVAGEGPQAVLASRTLRAVPERDAAPLLQVTPPPLGDPERPDHVRAIAALIARPVEGAPTSADGFVRATSPLDLPGDAVVPAWREAVPVGDGEVEDLRPARLPVAWDGRPAAVDGGSAACGAAEDPCRIALGEGLQLGGALPSGWLPSGGLRATVDRRRVTATAPGRYRILGLRDRDGALVAPIHVEVLHDDSADSIGSSDGASAPAATAPGEDALRYEAEKAHAADDPVLPLLASRPSLENWSPPNRARVAQLRFEAADEGTAEAQVAAFEDLRDEAPSTAVALEDVAATARAYRAVGRPDRALEVWRRALGQGFLAEATVANEIQGAVGGLAALQALREVVSRYPEVPLVEQAAFALPDRLLDLADALPPEAVESGATPVDVKLMAAAWDREFVVLHPDSPLAPEAGLRLATGLYRLGAREAALAWVRRLAAAHPDHALTDRWLLLGALIETELGAAAAARRDLTQLAEEEVPLGGGRRGPSALRDDARFALGRLAEANDDPDSAVGWYRRVGGEVPEARLALSALEAVRFEVPRMVRLEPGEPARVEVLASNVDEVHASVFTVDLRTLFLRESGLPHPESLRVEGLAPAWTGSRQVGVGPFPDTVEVPLPLSGPGAWLVRLDGDGVSAATLVVRSGLALALTDADQRRVALRFGDRPASDVEVRAVTGSGILATRTDPRGVALVPTGAPTLAQQGRHYAFTDDAGEHVPSPPLPSSGKQAEDVLLQRLERRDEARRRAVRDRYDFIGDEYEASIDASEL